MRKLILSLCDLTGTWSKPYADNPDYEVIRLDVQHDGRAGDVRFYQYKLDSLKLARRPHGIIAQPPCTHFAGSGARWWKGKGDDALSEGLAIVDACIRIIHVNEPQWWVLENPVGRLRDYLGPPRMTAQPHWYAGHADDPSVEQYTKRTCLWGNFNAALVRSELPPVLGSKMHKLPPSPQRQNLRSATPQGFARAFYSANP